jgi:hypothetical protein
MRMVCTCQQLRKRMHGVALPAAPPVYPQHKCSACCASRLNTALPHHVLPRADMHSCYGKPPATANLPKRHTTQPKASSTLTSALLLQQPRLPEWAFIACSASRRDTALPQHMLHHPTLHR